MKSVFDIFIVFLQILQQNFIKVSIAVIVAFGVGCTYDMYKPKVYASKMIVKPLFDSKYQLVTNIRYYNELVSNRKLDKLSSLFNLNKELVPFINAEVNLTKIKNKSNFKSNRKVS